MFSRFTETLKNVVNIINNEEESDSVDALKDDENYYGDNIDITERSEIPDQPNASDDKDNNNNITSDVNNDIKKYYDGIKALNDAFFQNNEYMKNPDLLVGDIKDKRDKIEELEKVKSELTVECDRKRSIYNLKNSLDQVQEENNKLKHITKNLETEIDDLKKVQDNNINKENDIKTMIDNNEIKMKEYQNEYQNLSAELSRMNETYLSIKSEYEKNKREYETILKKIETSNKALDQNMREKQNSANRYEQIKNEYVALTNKLNALQSEDQYSLDIEETENIKKYERANEDLMREINGIKKKKDELLEGNSLDMYYNMYADLKKQINEKEGKKDSNPFNNTSSEREEITRLLFEYSSSKDISKLKKYFGWSESDMNTLIEENQNIFVRSTKMFTAFRDSWSNWLINAANK